MTDEEYLEHYSDWLNDHYKQHFYLYVNISIEEFAEKQSRLIDELRECFLTHEEEFYGPANTEYAKRTVTYLHNHFTRDIKNFGECAGCDQYHLRYIHGH